MVVQSDNVGDTYAAAGSYLVNAFGLPGAADPYPLSGALMGAVVSTSSFDTVQEFNYDFNDTRRHHTYRGAYSGGGVNPGWQLAMTNKPIVGGAIFDISFGDEGFRATVPTLVGRNHCFDYAHDVFEPTWIAVTNIIGDGVDHNVVDPPSGSPTRTYRTRTTF